MKLKEWGFMRHKPRRTAPKRNDDHDEEEQDERDSSATVEPMSVEPTPTALCQKQGGWQVLSDTELAEAEPTFMGLLHQAPT